MTDDGYHGRGSSPADQPSGTERDPKSRTKTQRDRDRVLYSSAFRRLAGITQVATPEAGHLFHSRLTHTLKVAQVAVRLAERLIRQGLDPELVDVDAVETAALAHDLGHPPFGHIAEHELNRLGDAWGGFEGNAQSFRIVTKLAVNKPDYWGLGLTARSLNGILKYPWLRGENPDNVVKWGAYASERDHFLRARHGHVANAPSFEAQIMDWADDVTFAVHDFEDFFRAGLIPLDRLVSSERERAALFESCLAPGLGELRPHLKAAGLTKALLEGSFRFLFEEFFVDTSPFTGTREDRSQLRRRTSYLISRYDHAATVAVDARDGATRATLKIAPEIRSEVSVLKELTWHYVIRRPSLAVVQEGQRTIIAELFTRFAAAAASEQGRVVFPSLERELLNATHGVDEQMRVVIDFISGLTETMVYDLHRRITGMGRGSILDSGARTTF